ncbi:hypothetical protein E0H80_16530 [Acinetobacter sp. ANC 4779]|uniref:hypothetical protein n=1 Tax=Acinetobacter sp. ANC 4779 TaxID=2529848 RepID=UPI0010391B05|nr:hypothetical protein [Acinetobacter sp. ANC 4779]TCB46959.1 hypothetical protein E0H80_16530 [Acinetobacter sp. ANC 4779]
MGIAIFCLIIGFTIGYLIKDTQHKKEEVKTKKKQSRNVYLSYNERQRAKIRYLNDADRIRQLNLLSHNESKFMRLLQHQFTENNLIIKDRRFYIVDQDNYPIAIFEYRDGSKELKVNDIEDGLPVFLYKAILSSEEILKDKESISIKRDFV